MNDINLLVTSDWHLGHDYLVDAGHRPKNFGQRIISNHVSVAKRDDVMLHLGDAYHGPEGEFGLRNLLRELKARGVKTIGLRGNHDPVRFERFLRMGWDWVCDSLTLTYHHRKFLFTHLPVETNFSEDYNVHGHLHSVDGHRGGLIRDGQHILISMELLDYRPIPLERIIQIGQTPVRRLAGKFVGEGDPLVDDERNIDGVGNPEESEKAR